MPRQSALGPAPQGRGASRADRGGGKPSRHHIRYPGQSRLGRILEYEGDDRGATAAGAQNAVVGIFHAPEIAKRAHELGIGGVIESLSGRVPGRVRNPFPDPGGWKRSATGAFAAPRRCCAPRLPRWGPTAGARAGGVRVLVVTIRQQPIHRETFSHIGVDPEAADIIVLKSSAHFRSASRRSPGRCLIGLAAGTNPDDPQSFAFTKIRPGLRLRPGISQGAQLTRLLSPHMARSSTSSPRGPSRVRRVALRIPFACSPQGFEEAAGSALITSRAHSRSVRRNGPTAMPCSSWG